MTGFIAKVFPYRNRVSLKEAFEVLEPDDGKPSCPVLRGPGDRVAWLLDDVDGGCARMDHFEQIQVSFERKADSPICCKH